jgi:bacterioferritin
MATMTQTQPLSQPSSPSNGEPFLRDVRMIRERARQLMNEGAVTPNYGANVEQVVEVLNQALATEIVCVLRYKRHYFMAAGLASESVKAEFLEHANEEQAHVDQIAERIVQLGGAPNFDPDGLAMRSHSEYVPGETLRDMIKEDLVAERIAIESYRDIVGWLGAKDSTTRKLMEEILAKEEEHAEDMFSLLQGLRD